MRRKWIAQLLVLALGAGVSMPLGVWAAGSSLGSRAGSSFSGAVDHQIALTARKIGTRSTEWTAIAGLSGFEICAQNEVSVTVFFGEKMGSAEPELRVLMDGKMLLPGRVRISAGKYDPRSFMWVGNATNTQGTDHHTMSVEWRVSFDEATFNMAVENVLYENGTTC
jgi:hypothetical protein